jgi:hypothetical protein
MFDYRCKLHKIILDDPQKDLCLDLDLGFDITYRAEVQLINVRTPNPRGLSRSLGLNTKEYIGSWFEENDDGSLWPFIAAIYKNDIDGSWLADIFAADKPETLNERLLGLGWGDN